jgi:hypothetical protein
MDRKPLGEEQREQDKQKKDSSIKLIQIKLLTEMLKCIIV